MDTDVEGLHAPHRAVPRPSWWVPLLRWAPGAALATTLALRVVHPPAYYSLVEEDGPAEWATFVVYMIAAGVAVAVARRLEVRQERQERLMALGYVAIAAAFVFVGGEEISWGQRIVGFTGPEALVERNVQDEANLHNLLGPTALHSAYIVVGLYGAGLGRWLLRGVTPLRDRWWLLAPGPSVGAFFLSVAALYLYYEVLDHAVVAVLGTEWSWQALRLARLQEVAELCLAAGFVAFVLEVYRRLGPTGTRG